MTKAEEIVRELLPDIADKTILEAACGGAEFSIAASGFARDVYCIDVDDSRLDTRIKRENIHFEQMDAAAMRYPDETFDAVFVYNALYHIRTQWEAIERECRRVLKPGGKIHIIATWKLDRSLLDDMFLGAVRQNAGVSMVELKAHHM